jgi:hypothetical protein
MCLAVLRRDGFVSLDAGKEGGELITRPFIAPGNRLLLNVAVRDGGRARVEVLGADNNPIPGFRLRDCAPLKADDINQAVSWRSGATLSQLGSQPLRLRFELKGADLYSFRFAR